MKQPLLLQIKLDLQIIAVIQLIISIKKLSDLSNSASECSTFIILQKLHLYQIPPTGFVWVVVGGEGEAYVFLEL